MEKQLDVKQKLFNDLNMFHQLYQVFQPHPALKEFVNNIMIQRVTLDPSKPEPVFLLPPIQEQALFFYLLDPIRIGRVGAPQLNQLPKSVFVARRKKLLHVMMGYNQLVIKVGFQPGGLFRLLGIPLIEFDTDDKVYESGSFDREIPLIIEQLNEAASYEDMLSVLQTWLLGKLNRLKKELPLDKALPYILKKGTQNNITDLADEACVSIRQLERLFQQRIGHSPQQFARLVRFTKAWILKENNPAISWADLVCTCGYFDQMHLIRDFKEFTGVTPSLVQKGLQDLPCSLQHQVFL